MRLGIIVIIIIVIFVIAIKRWLVRLGTGALPWVALAILIGGLILILIVMVRMVIMTISKLCDGDSIIMPMKCFSQTGGRSCYTVNQDKCVFPFRYKGQKFTQCTTVVSYSNHTSIYKKKYDALNKAC